ncbi:hypothetical protein AMK19_09445 [Kitasatospora sp. CB01950]|nr:hypothetical protein AMK19_09445 [Kitasatospora sp. CB01950]
MRDLPGPVLGWGAVATSSPGAPVRLIRTDGEGPSPKKTRASEPKLTPVMVTEWSLRPLSGSMPVITTGAGPS